MSSRAELLDIAKRMLWLDKEMEKNYAQYSDYLSDTGILKIIRRIHDDEVRHVNIGEKIVSILSR